MIYSAAPGIDDIFFAPDTLAPSGAQMLTHSLAFNPTSALIVGVNPGVGAEGPHVIMFTNDEFATDSVGFKWSDLFSEPHHSTLISLLTGAHAGDSASIAGVSGCRVLERGRHLQLRGRSYRTRHAPLDLNPAPEPPSSAPARISGNDRPEFPEPTAWVTDYVTHLRSLAQSAATARIEIPATEAT